MVSCSYILPQNIFLLEIRSVVWTLEMATETQTDTWSKTPFWVQGTPKRIFLIKQKKKKQKNETDVFTIIKLSLYYSIGKKELRKIFTNLIFKIMKNYNKIVIY